MVSVTTYFDLFVNVMLALRSCSSWPVIIFFLTLLRILSPRWLMANTRYADSGDRSDRGSRHTTPDVFNLMLFAVPMCALYSVGVLASYMLVLQREGGKFHGARSRGGHCGCSCFAAGAVYVAIRFYHFHLIRHWPF